MTGLISLFVLVAFAQQQALVKQQSQAMANALVKADYGKALTYIYPKVVVLWGGREFLLKNAKSMVDKMQASGFVIKGINAGNPGKIQTYGPRLFCVMNHVITFTSNGTTTNGRAAVLAVSENKGVKWYFVIGGTISNQALYKLFPEIEGKILLPAPDFPGLPGMH